MNILPTTRAELVTIPAANRAPESGMPIADNMYIMNYESTPITAKNMGNRLEISAPQTSCYSDHAMFNDTMFIVSKINLVSLSKHKYKTSLDIGHAFSKTTCGRAVGELVIFHRPANMPNTHPTDKPLIVYMPIYQSDTQTAASGVIQSIIDGAGKCAPTINESTPIYMPRMVDAFNLNKLLPAESYVFYETVDAKHIVFPYQCGIPVLEHTADVLRNIVQPIDNPTDEPVTLFWNALPARTKANREHRVRKQEPVRYRGSTRNNSIMPDAPPADDVAPPSRTDGFATGTFADAMDVLWGGILRTAIGLGMSLLLLIIFSAIYSFVVHGTLDGAFLNNMINVVRALSGTEDHVSSSPISVPSTTPADST